jgi:arylsulfatase A-like enzyme
VRYTCAVRRVVAVCVGAIGLVAGCGGSPRLPPNLLLITIDTLRADRLTCYAGPAGAGARICALFEHGIRYRWAFATAPSTAPSIVSLLTSRYPADHGVTQSMATSLGSHRTIAEHLRAAGYTTAAFVSNPVLDSRRKLARGFEVYDQQMTRRERNRPDYVEREAAATTDAVLAWAQTERREPWFVWVHFQDPHGPYDAPGAPAREDPPGVARLPVLDDLSGRDGIPAYQALPGLFTPQAYESRYLDEIAYLDVHVERLVAGLDALGRRSALLLAADHGEAFGEDGYWFAHGHSVGLDQIRVPLLFRPARPGAGAVVDTPVSLLDVSPTLMDLAGLEIPSAFRGRPLPRANSDPERAAPIFAEHEQGVAAIHGRHFYARARFAAGAANRPDAAPDDRRFAPRSAELAGDDGALPDYRAIRAGDPAPALENALADFVERMRGRSAPQSAPVSDEVRARMRALGYEEE